MNYIPILNLKFPTIIIYMFSYLNIVNSDIQYFEDWFFMFFNLNQDTFPTDRAINDNFDQAGYTSMRILRNLGSQLAIICSFIILMPILLIVKNLMHRCCNR
jgi:hypothetical protein